MFLVIHNDDGHLIMMMMMMFILKENRRQASSYRIKACICIHTCIYFIISVFIFYDALWLPIAVFY